MQHKQIIISAYTCSPNMGSEPGMAWNWVKGLSKHFKIHLITNKEFKNDLLKGIEENQLKERIIIYFNDIGLKATEMGKNQGDWRFYYYYRKWQKKTYQIAQEIVLKNEIYLVHQLNMIGFREPGYLWKLKTPSVWGPIGGLNFLPLSFINKAPNSLKIKLYIKNILNYIQLKFSIRVHFALENFNIVIGAIKNSKEALKKYKGYDVPVLNETGCNLIKRNKMETNRFLQDEFNILWVGKAMYRKQLNLALEIIENLSRLGLRNVKLHVVGVKKKEMFNESFLKKNKNLNILQNIVWHGKVTHNQVTEMMRLHQLFLFTSIDEGTPHVILEAIENQLPIICFDTCGQGECVVDGETGILVKLTSPKKAIQSFSNNISNLYFDRNFLIKLSENSLAKSKELSWDSKIEAMLDYYKDAYDNFNNN